jgi:ankyrin repeat protein
MRIREHISSCGVALLLVSGLSGLAGCSDQAQSPIAAEQREFDGLTPLHRAAATGEIESLEQMLSEQHANPDLRDAAQVTPIHYAARSGELAAVRMLVSYGADPNAKTHNGWTALQIAFREGQLEIVHFLSQYGFDPNGTMPEGARC